MGYNIDIDSAISSPGDYEYAQYQLADEAINEKINSEFYDQYINFNNLEINLLDIYSTKTLPFEIIYDFLNHVDDIIGIQQLDSILLYETKSNSFFKAIYTHLYINIQKYITEINRTNNIDLLNLPIVVIRENLLSFFKAKMDRYSQIFSEVKNCEGKLLELQIVCNILDNDITNYINQVLRKL